MTETISILSLFKTQHTMSTKIQSKYGMFTWCISFPRPPPPADVPLSFVRLDPDAVA